MQTVFEDDHDVEPREEQDDPSSECYAVTRITQDREELFNVLRSMAEDPRVSLFLKEYEWHYQILINSNINRLKLRESGRELRAKSKVSQAKSVVVEGIYMNTDERIYQLRRDINIVYHHLIEVQEAEDASRKTIASYSKDIADLNASFKERMKGVPPQQMKLKERIEKKCDDVRAERDRSVAEVERFREEFARSNTLQAWLEKDRLRIEERIAECQREFSRVNNDIAKETAKKNKLKAALQAGQAQYENCEKDKEELMKQLGACKDQSKAIAEATRATTVKTEKMRLTVNSMATKFRSKQQEYEEMTGVLHQLETEVSHVMSDVKKRTQEMEALKELSNNVDKVRRMLRHKVNETGLKKEGIIRKREKEKLKNQELANAVINTKRKLENAIKEQTDLLRKRDYIRKALMKEKATMHKDHMLLILHQLANKRLNHDNACLMDQARDQTKTINKLESERDNYIRQALHLTRKVVVKAEREKRMMENIFTLMKMIAGEEMKMLETQNLYEATRNEHVLYTRHILHLRDVIATLKAKATAMSYETQKLLQERDYRDECLMQEELFLQKLNRQIFVLKVNLRDLKESNARMKMIIENQDLEEKNLIKMTRVMNSEKMRESKGLERVIRDIDGLDLALTRRHHELHELFKMVKLKQSLLHKGENMYNVRWKELGDLKASLMRTKALRRLDTKNRAVLDRLLKCVELLKTHLENVRLRSKGLMEELSHPRNIHRWRNLLGRDPEAYESVRNLHKIRQTIQQHVEKTEVTVTQIHLLDRQYISLTTSVRMQPAPETVLQLKIYQNDLHTRYSQITTLTAELREALDNKTDMVSRDKAVTRKLNQINILWIKYMHKEKKRILTQGLQESGPLPLLPGPEGLERGTKAALEQLKTPTRRQTSTPSSPPAIPAATNARSTRMF